MSVGWLPETYCRTVDVNLGKYVSLSQYVWCLSLHFVECRHNSETRNIMFLNDLAVRQPEFKHKIPSTITSKIAITLQLRSSHAGGI